MQFVGVYTEQLLSLWIRPGPLVCPGGQVDLGPDLEEVESEMYSTWSGGFVVEEERGCDINFLPTSPAPTMAIDSVVGAMVGSKLQDRYSVGKY